MGVELRENPLSGGGQMGALMRSFDWSQSVVGPVETWPKSLQTAVRMILGSRFPMFVWWGPQLVNFYNDAYSSVLGARHPLALCRPARSIWQEIWDTIGPQAEMVMTTGQATWNEERLLVMERNGYLEETYFTWSYSPFPDDNGGIGGVFCACTEDTVRVVNQRRLKTLRELSARAGAHLTSTAGACQTAMDALAENPDDIPFALIYLLDSESQTTSLAGLCGVPPTSRMASATVALTTIDSETNWPVRSVLSDRIPQVVTDLQARFGDTPSGRWPEPPREAVVLPILRAGTDQAAGVLVVGINPRRPLDDDYRGFLDLLAGHVSTALANARLLEAERQRAKAIRESEQRFRSFADAAPAMLWVTDDEGRCTLLSRSWCEFTGQTEDEGLGFGWLAAVHPDDREAAGVVFRDAVARRQPFACEYRLRRRDGEYRWALDAAHPRFAPDGSYLGFSGSVLELTARKRAEELTLKLQEKVNEFETLLDVIPVGIGIAHDRECSNISVNPAFASALGIAPKQNASKTAPQDQRPTNFRVIDEDGHEIPDEQLPLQVAAREGRIVRDAEFDVVHQDGRVVRLLEYAAPLFDENHQVRGAVGAFVDITDRRAAEARLKFLVQLSDAVRPLTDPNEITATVARILGEHLGADRCAYADVEADQDTFNLTGDYNRGVPSIVGRYTFTQFGTEVLRLMRENKPYVVYDVDHHEPALSDVAAYRQTGIQAVICVPLHKGGKFVAAMAVHQTTPRQWTTVEVELVQLAANRCWESIERARIARTLTESESKFRQLANTIPQLAWMARPDGWIFWYNDRWYEYTGTTLEQMQGWGWESVHDPVELKRMSKTWRAALESGQPWDDMFPLRRHDGEFRWHLSRALPLRDDDGNIVLWFGTNTDVTDQRRLTQEREELLESERAARSEAERISRMKDEFLATLSHELRTPLNAILGYATLMRMVKMGDAELADSIATIERNARVQAQLIEDLLDMNRIVSGKIRLEIQQVNLSDVIAAAVETVQPSADAKGIRLETIADPAAGTVRADPARIQQVIWNLLSNAIKFTGRDGKVQVALSQVDSHVEITVSDTGQGISAEFLPYVFDRFRQADGSTTRQFGGLGLGLSIVRQLVELHGGTVSVRSPGEGKGATFTVTLPLAVLHDYDHVTMDRLHPRSQRGDGALGDVRVELQGVRVLVVDDEPDATALVRRVLEEYKAEVVEAGSAHHAFELLSRERFDVLVSDIGMPGQDGYQFIQRVRARDDDHRAIPAVALTAFARSEDRKRAVLAGFQNHLSKPVEAGELIAVIASLAGRTGV